MTINDKLISAIREGNYEETVNCLLKGANVNYYDHGFTPLTASINNHDARISKLLLETERVSESELKSALSIAMSVKDKNITKEVIKYMKDFKQGFMCTNKSFHKLAIDNKWPDILELMIDKGAVFQKINSMDVNPLHYAAQQKDPIYVQILGKTLPVDSYCDEEVTPLMVAAENGNTDTMDALLKLGANPNAQQKPRVKMNFLLPSILRAAVIASNLIDIDSVVHKATYSGNPKTIDVLLKYNPQLDLNKFGSGSKTPLMIAAEKGNHIMVHHLLKLGVNVNARNGNGNALHFAIDGKSCEVAVLLLVYGINQNHRSNDYKTPLDKAIYQTQKYGINHSTLIAFLKYAKAHPKEVVCKKPVYFPGKGPRGPREDRE